MIGTNNSENSAEEVADGIIAVCKRIHDRLPETKILLLAILPREHESSYQRQKNAKASLMASKIADGDPSWSQTRSISGSIFNFKKNSHRAEIEEARTQPGIVRL